MTTLFKEEAKTYQDGELRTKGKGVSFTLVCFGICLAVTVGAWLVNELTSASCKRVLCILVIAQYVAPVLAVVFLVWAVINMLRPTKQIRCPACGREHIVYQSVTKYMCPDCYELLLMAKGPAEEIGFSQCRYCGRRTAVSPGHGLFSCPDCGTMRGLGSGEPSYKQIACPGCGSYVPQDAIYCTKCERSLKTVFKRADKNAAPGPLYDMDWKIGKSGPGHLHYCKALLAGLDADNKSAEDVKAVQDVLARWKEIFVSLEEALADSSTGASARKMIVPIDLAYCETLAAEKRVLSAVPPKKKFGKDELEGFRLEPHMAARRRVEAAVGLPGDLSGGTIGVWGDKLVEVDRSDSGSKIKTFDPLVAEEQRFSRWKAGLRT